MPREFNFDGIVGPTHNYSGLAYGNVASMKHGRLASNPRQAALQGLNKMRMLMRLGIPQAVLPPQERPFVPLLRCLGFNGSDSEILARAFKESPEVLYAACSASAMWAANSATVSPSSDSLDQRVHFTPANLCSQLHRSIEAASTERLLRRIFEDERFFVHHSPLPSVPSLADEGAANHTRLAKAHGKRGIQLFTYGRKASSTTAQPHRYPARQTLEASQTLARLHALDPYYTFFAQQLPVAIDAGVFHNDVISVGNENFFLYHEQAFVDEEAVIAQLREAMRLQCDADLLTFRVAKEALSLEEAVNSYLFNSQILTIPDGGMILVAPEEAKASSRVQELIGELLTPPSPIQDVHYFNLRQSMQNGGGPACLRLRVVLTPQEASAMHQGVLLTETLCEELIAWVKRHYRDVLSPDDLADPSLLRECRTALDELTAILGIGSIYNFQIS